MAYNYYPTYQPYFNYPMQQQAPQQAQQPVQQSTFVLVRSEQEARSYPVAPGNSVTFKDESQPFCYVKTMGFNQLDRPVFEKYRLVKEDAPEPEAVSYASKDDVEAIWAEVNAIKEKMTERKTIKAHKVEETDND